MYCQSCGKEVNAALSYCNQCGARLNAGPDPRTLPAANFNLLFKAVIGLPFVGLAMIIGVIAALTGIGVRDEIILGATFLTFVLFAIAEVGCIIMLLTRTKAAGNPPPDRALPTADLYRSDETTRLNLGSPTFEPIPVGSVTDHTTRALDPAVRREPS